MTHGRMGAWAHGRIEARKHRSPCAHASMRPLVRRSLGEGGCARALLLFTACLVCWAAACPEGRAQAAFEVYENPRPAVSGGKLYLFARVISGEQESCICLVEVGAPADGWKKLGEFRADYGCVAESGGRFYLFLRESVIELQAETCEKTGGVRWPFDWRPQSAEVVGGVLMAFGVGGDGTLYGASAPMKTPRLPTSSPPGSFRKRSS